MEEFEDPFKIPYELLPLAPPPSTKPTSLWELFLLGSRPSAPFPLPSEAAAVRKRRGA
jgi:hypothetical protein